MAILNNTRSNCL